jgi:hypothetical protein
VPATVPASAEKLADNLWYHPLHVPKIGWLRTGYQGCIRAVRKKLREIRPDIAHGSETERECAISAVFSGLLNAVTIQGNPHPASARQPRESPKPEIPVASEIGVTSSL